MKKQIITIAGRPGSGKSTTAALVASQLGFKRFSTGELFRAVAKERGIDVLQANLSAEGNYELDHLVDGRLREIGQTQDKLVIDSRMAWHFIPESFKVYLDLDLTRAAERILSEMGESRLASEHIDKDPKQYAKILASRLDSENRRYKSLYKVDPYDLSQYDLVIDTGTNSPQVVADLVVKGFLARQQ